MVRKDTGVDLVNNQINRQQSSNSLDVEYDASDKK